MRNMIIFVVYIISTTILIQITTSINGICTFAYCTLSGLNKFWYFFILILFILLLWVLFMSYCCCPSFHMLIVFYRSSIVLTFVLTFGFLYPFWYELYTFIYSFPHLLWIEDHLSCLFSLFIFDMWWIIFYFCLFRVVFLSSSKFEVFFF